MSKLSTHLTLNKYQVKFLFVLFYTVGVIGVQLPLTRPMFLTLTPFTLIASFSILLLYAKGIWNVPSIVLMLFIALVGFGIEWVGVKTGIVFGSYKYGSGLGYKIGNTPVLIGVNWLVLSYATAVMIKQIVSIPFLRIVFAALLMLGYDIAMEPSAGFMHLWYWHNGGIPLQNYIAWFALALTFQWLIVSRKLKLNNAMSNTIIICQFLFFLAITLINKF